MHDEVHRNGEEAASVRRLPEEEAEDGYNGSVKCESDGGSLSVKCEL